MLEKLKTLIQEARRNSYAAFAVLLGLLFISKGGREILQQQVGVLAWKLVLVGTAVVTAHIVRKQLFPYLDLSAALARKTTEGAITFAATALVYTGVILAICAGL